MPHFFENYAGVWASTGGESGVRTMSTSIYVGANVKLTHLGWYRGATSGQTVPDDLRIWDHSTGTILASAASITDSGTVGWQWCELPAQPILQANREYRVGERYINGAVRWRQTTIMPAASIPSPLSYGSGTRAFSNVNGADYPGPNADSGTNEPYSIMWDVVPTGGAELTEASIENALVRWLSADADNTRQEHLPWLTHLLSTDTNTRLTALQGVTDTILDGIDAAMGPGGTLITGTLRALLDDLFDTELTRHQATRDTVMGPGNPTIADVMAAVAAIETGGSCHFPMTVGSPDWTQVGQTTGDGGSEWAQDADAYVFHIEELGPGARLAEGVGSEIIYWIRGWAMPWDGTNVYPHRVNFVGPDAVIVGNGHWPGILMQVPTGVEWTLTAYNYTP